MFTGIVEEKGTVVDIQRGEKISRLKIKAKLIFDDLKIGDSVAVNGVCLTATKISEDCFLADVMNETFMRSTLGSLKRGSHVNLERAMAADGRFGGHIVSGHIDDTGIVEKIQRDGNAVWYTICAKENILKYIVEKGSIAIDGISLTVARVDSRGFSVSVIPHTLEETIIGGYSVGSLVNLENDIVGKYVERLIIGTNEHKCTKAKGSITMEFLAEAGF